MTVETDTDYQKLLVTITERSNGEQMRTGARAALPGSKALGRFGCAVVLDALQGLDAAKKERCSSESSPDVFSEKLALSPEHPRS